MKKTHSVVTLFLLTSIAVSVQGIGKNSYIEATRAYYKSAYSDAKPEKRVNAWLVPFDTKDRFSLRTIRVISIFGDHRDSYLKGHIHTATDMIPAQKADTVYVYPIAEGVVCSIHLTHPHKTIVVKHLQKNGQIVFSSYKHLQEIYVWNGMQVDCHTKLARLYTRQETKKYKGSYDHLHLEIRKSFYDYGCASWLTMNSSDLNELFYNPLSFLKEHLGTEK